MAYDPVKAHEYYMKHRKLKGRKKVNKIKPKKGRAKKAKKVTFKTRTSTEGLNESGMAAANEVKARINVEKQEFTKKLNETMKAKIKELQSQMAGMDETEKKVAVEKIKMQFAEAKKQAAEALKEKYAKSMDEIKANKDYKS